MVTKRTDNDRDRTPRATGARVDHRRGTAGPAGALIGGLPAGIRATATGLVIVGALTEVRWWGLGAALARACRRLPWYIGDWLNAGERHGYIQRRRYGEVEQRTAIDRKTLRNLAWVARAVESSRRRDDLSWTHHEGVASLVPQEQSGWLARAAAERWTRAQLREAVRRATASALPDPSAGRCPDLRVLIRDGLRFGTIYADPPWRYDNEASRAAANGHYPTMALEDIAALPVGDLAAPNAHLHLWTTNAFLSAAPAIIEAWGFTYQSCFVWVKPQMGLGNYWRVSHEFLLLGVRGSCGFADNSLRSWLEARRSTHSAKPEAVRALIERASPAPRLELFARRTQPGWTVWGNEVQTDVRRFRPVGGASLIPAARSASHGSGTGMREPPS